MTFQPPQHTKPKDWSRIHLSTTAFSKRQSLIKPWFLELYVWAVAGWVLFAEFAAMLWQNKNRISRWSHIGKSAGEKNLEIWCMPELYIVFSHLKKIWPHWPRLFLLKTSSKQQNLAKPRRKSKSTTSIELGIWPFIQLPNLKIFLEQGDAYLQTEKTPPLKKKQFP